MEFHRDDEPIFVISVAARLLQVHPQTLRYYERVGLLKPTRSSGKIRLYSQKEIERLRKIQRLTNELGVNLAGVEIIIDLTERLENLQAQMQKREEELTAEINRLRQELDRLQ
jgi:MerR family transcriptional regulator/heat shock protein HspR